MTALNRLIEAKVRVDSRQSVALASWLEGLGRRRGSTIRTVLELLAHHGVLDGTASEAITRLSVALSNAHETVTAQGIAPLTVHNTTSERGRPVEQAPLKSRVSDRLATSALALDRLLGTHIQEKPSTRP
jgi:hypothetical protein